MVMAEGYTGGLFSHLPNLKKKRDVVVWRWPTSKVDLVSTKMVNLVCVVHLSERGLEFFFLHIGGLK